MKNQDNTVVIDTAATEQGEYGGTHEVKPVGLANTTLKATRSGGMVPIEPMLADAPIVIPPNAPKIIELLFEHLDFDTAEETSQAISFLRLLLRQGLQIKMNLRCLLYFGGGRVYELLRDMICLALHSYTINLALPAQARLSGLSWNGVNNLAMKQFMIATLPMPVPQVVLAQMASLANQIVLSTGLNQEHHRALRMTLPILCSPADLMDLKYSMELEKAIVPFMFKPDGLTEREFDLLQNEVLSEAERQKFYDWIMATDVRDVDGRDLLSLPADRSVFRTTINRWKYSQNFPTYFIETHCEQERGAEIRNKDLFRFYWAICEAYKLPKPIDVAEFGRIMGRIGIKTSPRKHRDEDGQESTQRFYIGLLPKSTSIEQYATLMPTEEQLTKRLTDFYAAEL